MKKLMPLLLILMIALPVQAQEVARGRYMQEKLALPQGMEYVRQMWVDEQGRVTLMGVKSAAQASDPVARRLMICTLKEDGSWQNQVPAWSEQLLGKEFSAFVCGDTAYVCAYASDEKGGTTQQVWRSEGDRLVSVDAGEMLDDLNSILDLAASGDGTIIAQSYQPGAYGYNAQTGQRRVSFERANGEMYVAGDRLYTLSQQDGCVLAYDVISGELLYEMTDAPLRETNALYADGESLYLLNVGGIYRIALGGSMWEQLVDGALTDLRLPYSFVKGLTMVRDAFYVLVSTDDGAKLLRFVYDPSVTTLPTQTLVVYTLRQNRLLEQAASIFQSENPDYLVQVTTLLGEDTGATRQDVLGALSVQLLAGKGPDVMVLDGLPAASYIEKGVLADLSGVVNPLLESGELLNNLFTPFFAGEAIYQLPARVSLPLALSTKECVGWDELVDAVEKGLRLPARTREGYLEMFLPVNLGAWFYEDGSLNTAELAGFLSDLDRVYAACGVEDDAQADENRVGFISVSARSVIPMGGYGLRLEEAVKLGERYDLLPCILESLGMGSMALSKMEDTGGRMDFLPGRAGKVYVPSSLIGVNARSAQQQAAMDFVRVLIGSQVQDADTYDGGTAVNRLSLQNMVEHDGLDTQLVSVTMVSDIETGESMMVSGRWPSRATRERFCELLSQADTPYAPDESLLELVRDALSPYCLGEMDPQTAAQAVADKVRAYLAE